MQLIMHISNIFCPMKFLFARRHLAGAGLRILDVGCGNNSPTTTKHWFPGSSYAGADIERHNNDDADMSAMDVYYQVGVDGSGYDAIPDGEFDFVILNHVVEHMSAPEPILAKICQKLKPGGYIWIAFPSVKSLSLPSGEGTLQFCDDFTHIRLPDVREVSNVLLANQVKVLHAGRSRPFTRTMIGVALLPWAFLRRLLTGKLSGKGLWYILGFEDHVFGQRREA